MSPPEPTAVTRSEELLRVAQEYADLFNSQPFSSIDRLIADACVDPLWDDRTNLLAFMAEETQDMGLVLATTTDDYVIVRFVDEWVVDTSPLDWDALEDRAFDGEDEADLEEGDGYGLGGGCDFLDLDVEDDDVEDDDAEDDDAEDDGDGTVGDGTVGDGTAGGRTVSDGAIGEGRAPRE